MKIVFGVVVENGVKVRRGVILENRVCGECGNEFEPKRQDSKYCSRPCSKKAERKRNSERAKLKAKEWYENNKEKASIRRKAYYWSDPEKFRKQTRDYFASRREQKSEVDSQYKDKVRHGGKRKELLEECGYRCAECGEAFSSRHLDAHHFTFDKTDHENQEILCKSCHTKLHQRNK